MEMDEENPPENIDAFLTPLWAEGQPDDAGHKLNPPEPEDLGFVYLADQKNLTGLADGTHKVGQGNWHGKVMCQYGFVFCLASLTFSKILLKYGINLADPCTMRLERGSSGTAFTSRPIPPMVLSFNYYFNSSTGKCEEFSYLGKNGNRNNFETISDCRNACGQRKFKAHFIFKNQFLCFKQMID